MPMVKRGNSKSLIILIIISVILIITLLFSSNFLMFEKEKSEKIPLELPILIKECENESSENRIRCENEIVKNIIIRTDSPELCKYFLNNPYCKKMEIVEEIFRTNNPSLCNLLENSDSCKRDYYTSKAIEKNDVMLCENIEKNDLRTICIDRVNYGGAVSIGDCSILKTEKYIKGCDKEVEENG